MQLVRIKRSSETERLGLAGRIGEDCGFTTLSVTAVSVIGDLREDYARSILFADTDEQLWFAEHLLEYLDHDPSLEVTICGKRVFYTSDGRWQEV